MPTIRPITGANGITLRSSGAPRNGPSVADHHRHCPMCQHDNRDRPQSAYSQRKWVIKCCGGCGFVYLENAVNYEALTETYNWSRTYRVEKESRRKREPVLEGISEFLKRFRRRYLPRSKALALVRRFVTPGNVLDIGCASGDTLRKLDSCYTPFGIEIDAGAARKANRYLAGRGGEVVHADALGGLQVMDSESFHGVLMQSFLEHEIQPKRVLWETRRILLPGGRLIIKVPNFASFNRVVRGRRWCGFRYPDHVNYFTPTTLRAMVQNAGLEIVRFTISDRLPSSDNMWLVAGRARS